MDRSCAGYLLVLKEEEPSETEDDEGLCHKLAGSDRQECCSPSLFGVVSYEFIYGLATKSSPNLSLIANSKGQRAKSKEQRAKNEGQRAKSKAGLELRILLFIYLPYNYIITLLLTTTYNNHSKQRLTK